VEVSLEDFRKDVILELYNEAGQLAIAYKIYRCWVSEFQALPDSTRTRTRSRSPRIKLENEGWERDYDVVEPKEPAFTEPSLETCMATASEWMNTWERARGLRPALRGVALLACAGRLLRRGAGVVARRRARLPPPRAAP